MQFTIGKDDHITRLSNFTATIFVIDKCIGLITAIHSTCSYSNKAILRRSLLCGHTDTGIICKTFFADGDRRSIRQIDITHIITRYFCRTGYGKAAIFRYIYSTTSSRGIAGDLTAGHIESAAGNVDATTIKFSSVLGCCGVFGSSITADNSTLHIESASRNAHSGAVFTFVPSYLASEHIEGATAHTHASTVASIRTSIINIMSSHIIGYAATIHIKGTDSNYTRAAAGSISGNVAAVHIEST